MLLPHCGQYDYLSEKVKKLTDEVQAKIARAKIRGAKPKVPREVLNNSTNIPSIKAVINAMNRCYRNNATLRPSAREVADYLQSELDAVLASSEALQ